MNATKVNQLDVLRAILNNGNFESRFASIVYTEKAGKGTKVVTPGTALYLVHLNMNYKKVLAHDLMTLLAQKPANETEALALAECIASVRETLETGRNSAYTLQDYYEKLSPAIGYHDNNLYIFCYRICKTPIVKGTYKETKSAPLTIAKNKYRAMCKKSNWRTFKISLDQLHEVRANGKTLLLDAR